MIRESGLLSNSQYENHAKTKYKVLLIRKTKYKVLLIRKTKFKVLLIRKIKYKVL